MNDVVLLLLSEFNTATREEGISGFKEIFPNLRFSLAIATNHHDKKSTPAYFKQLSALLPDTIQTSLFDLSNFSECREKLKKIDALMLTGGDTYTLKKLLDQAELVEEIRRFIYAGGLYCGFSAGAIVAGNSLKPAQKLGDKKPKDQDNSGCKYINADFWPHYEHKKHLQKVNELRSKIPYPLYTLKDGGYVVIENATAVVLKQAEKL